MIELTTAITLLVASLYGQPATAIAQDIQVNLNTQGKAVTANPITLEDYVRDYFAETKILAEISRCESQFRQMDKNGEVLRGKVNPADLGLMQINEKYHAERATKLGHNLETIEGNLAYAKYLYEKEGTQPWNASKPCWNK